MSLAFPAGTTATLAFDGILLTAVVAFLLVFLIRKFLVQTTLLRRVFRAWPHAIVIVDSDGLIQMFDHKAEQLTGYKEKEIRGQPLEILLPINRRARHAQVHMPAFFNQPTARQMGAGLDLNIRNSSGVHVPVDVSLSPVATSHGLYVLANVRIREDDV